MTKSRDKTKIVMYATKDEIADAAEWLSKAVPVILESLANEASTFNV